MSISEILFSFKGRINRKTFWIYHLMVLIVVTMVIVLLISFEHNLTAKELDKYIFGASIIILWPSLAISAKRCHDRDKSASWILVSFAPVIGVIWFIVELGCLKGTTGNNIYGKDPLQ